MCYTLIVKAYMSEHQWKVIEVLWQIDMNIYAVNINELRDISAQRAIRYDILLLFIGNERIFNIQV